MRLVLVVRRDLQPDAWTVRVPVDLEPGETVDRLAKDVARFWTRA